MTWLGAVKHIQMPPQVNVSLPLLGYHLLPLEHPCNRIDAEASLLVARRVCGQVGFLPLTCQESGGGIGMLWIRRLRPNALERHPLALQLWQWADAHFICIISKRV